jgi:hypothetical protein
MDRSGEVCLLTELNYDANVVGKYVRVTGYVSSIDIIAKNVEITHDEASLIVDISLVTTGSLRIGSLVQFIGEIQALPQYPQSSANPTNAYAYASADSNSQQLSDDMHTWTAVSTVSAPRRARIRLAAKIFRAVDGLDMRLYEEALLARRAFLRP